MRRAKKPLVLLILLLCCFACNIKGPDVEAKPGDRGDASQEEPEKTPLKLVLREGSPVDGSAPDEKLAEGVPLSPDRVAQLLQMFSEPLEVEKDKPEFLKRPSSKPAPRTAAAQEMPFPPTQDGGEAPDVSSQDLKVLSVSPQGTLDRAPRLSISFNNPMIAVSDPSSDEKGDPLGITIEPRPAGKWRWIGTQTLIFEPEGAEFPRATEYSVTVPAGIKDVNGSALTGVTTQKFTLPRPKVESFYPTGGGHDLDPLIYLVFDQPVVLPLVQPKLGVPVLHPVRIPLTQVLISRKMN